MKANKPKSMWMVVTEIGFKELNTLSTSNPSDYVIGVDFPIIASLEPIDPGIPLIPRSVFENRALESALEEHLKKVGSHDRPDITSYDFKAGYEAAGGYTREQMIALLDWYSKLTPSEKTSVWSKNGEHKDLFTMDNEQLTDRFIEKHISTTPKAIIPEMELQVCIDCPSPSINCPEGCAKRVIKTIPSSMEGYREIVVKQVIR